MRRAAGDRGGRFRELATPWQPTLDVSSPHPARFYVGLVGQTLEYGSPAGRRGGRVWALAGRRGLPERPLASVLRHGARALAPAAAPLEGVQALRAQWPALRAADPSLPVAAPSSVLALTRVSARTTFFFADSPSPVLVGKQPREGEQGVEQETTALHEAAQSGVAPRCFGVVAGVGHLQRGLAGRALRVSAVRPGAAGTLPWTAQHGALARGLVRLAATTGKAVVPAGLLDGTVEQGLRHPLVTEATREAVTAAVERLRGDAVSVLAHGDTSPQNVLFHGDLLSGLVDWADAQTFGLPGNDMWNAGLAGIDKAVGLVAWDEPSLFRAFAEGWYASPLGAQTRAEARTCAAAAGAADELHDARLLAFFTRRVGHRMQQPGSYPTSADLSARILELVRSRLDSS